MSKFVDMTFQIGISPLPPSFRLPLRIFDCKQREDNLLSLCCQKSFFEQFHLIFYLFYCAAATNKNVSSLQQTNKKCVLFCHTHCCSQSNDFFLFTFSYLEFSALIKNDGSRANRSANPKPISCPE